MNYLALERKRPMQTSGYIKFNVYLTLEFISRSSTFVARKKSILTRLRTSHNLRDYTRICNKLITVHRNQPRSKKPVSRSLCMRRRARDPSATIIFFQSIECMKKRTSSPVITVDLRLMCDPLSRNEDAIRIGYYTVNFYEIRGIIQQAFEGQLVKKKCDKMKFVKAFDKVRRDLLFDILQDKNIPNLLFQNIIEIYTDSKISVKINNCISERKLVNNGVRQGCPLSTTLFNIYINEIILKWNQIYTSGIKITSALTLNTLLYADDQVIISNSEDNLQRGLYTLNEILKDFGMEISAQKSKVMAF
ncbi:hypothetical protein ANN_23895 [Periplaneta americana]|uniref:Reverse transcriptase domain-containing protein n=1 Tax=Periplaneta americana TaxID=6978 RepID=A0ABQ8S1N0_PERAM|nr:hypothetical protein ANN_23895 [Periplaneta americana]